MTMTKCYARAAGASMTDDVYLGSVEGEPQNIAPQLRKLLPECKVEVYGADIVITGVLQPRLR